MARGRRLSSGRACVERLVISDACPSVCCMRCSGGAAAGFCRCPSSIQEHARDQAPNTMSCGQAMRTGALPLQSVSMPRVALGETPGGLQGATPRRGEPTTIPMEAANPIGTLSSMRQGCPAARTLATDSPVALARCPAASMALLPVIVRYGRHRRSCSTVSHQLASRPLRRAAC